MRRVLLNLIVLSAVATSAAAQPAPPAQAPAGYVFTTIAGNPTQPATVDGIGMRANFAGLTDVAVDAAGNTLVLDATDKVIRRVTAGGVVTTWAGRPGVVGTANGPRMVAAFTAPRSIAIAPDGTVFVSDNHVIRRIDTAGIVTTLAGVEGTRGVSDGVGTTARLTSPEGLSVAADGSIYFAEPLTNRVRRVAPDGTVTTVAGTGTAVVLQGLGRVAVAPGGTLFVKTATELIEMTSSGAIVTRSATPGLGSPTTLAVTAGGSVLMSDSSGISRIGAVPQQPLIRSSVIGSSAAFALAPDGALIVAASNRDILFRSQGTEASVTALAGGAYTSTGLPIDGSVNTATFQGIADVAVARDGTIWVTASNTVRRLSTDGTVTTVAGMAGVRGLADGSGAAARFDNPTGIAVLPNGDVAVADTYNALVRRVTPAGVVTTIAGGFYLPLGLAADSLGNIFVADHSDHVVRKINPQGVVTVYAGSGVSGIFDGSATIARFVYPDDVAVGADGVVYVTDRTTHRVRAIALDGTVTTLAGSDTGGLADGTGAAARFNYPRAIDVGSDGNLIVVDLNNCRLRRVTPAGAVTTIAGQSCSPAARVQDGHSAAVTFGESHVAGAPDARFVVVDCCSIRRAVPETETVAAIGADPVAVTALSGQTAVFTVTVSTGATVQWHHSSDAGVTWTALTDGGIYSGATTTTLTIPSAHVSMNGSQYRVVATNGHGSATSRSALLSVPVLASRPGALRFSAVTRESPGPIVTVTAPQTLTVLTGALSAGWTVSANQPWLQVSRSSGTGPAPVLVSIVSGGISLSGASELTGGVRFLPVAGGPAVEVPVTLQILTGNTNGPSNHIDTPVNDAVLRGSVAVTGWALDDVGIAHVRIYRGCLTVEPQVNCQVINNRSLVYIGDAARVPGARFEEGRDYPEHRSGGWGFLLLTNMLPRLFPFQPQGGQGRISLYSVATDLEGNRSMHGPITVDLDNDTIARPFGAIDTPGQGQVVSGTVPIFGWAITPDPGTGIEIPADGSRMVVFVDGLPIGLVRYNQCRGTVGNPVPSGTYCNDDVANIFGTVSPRPVFTTRTSNPSVYRNLDAARGAIGSYVLDTSSMSNGLHSLAWSVTDSADRVDGIGSRNFEVLNGAPDARPGVASSRAVATAATTVWMRQGFGSNDEWIALPPGNDGVRRVDVSVPGRVQLHLDGAIEAASLLVDGMSQPLPAGLSIRGAVLTWAPGPGYLGDYHLVLQSGAHRIGVIVTVRP